VLYQRGIIFGLEPTPYQLWASDVTQDQIINVIDVVQVVDIILNGSLVRGAPLQAIDIIKQHGQLSINTQGTAAGFQLQVRGSGQVQNVSGSENWQVFQDNNQVLVINITGSPDAGSLKLSYNGDLEILSGIAADWFGNSVDVVVTDIPDALALRSIYPNPFNPETTIVYELARQDRVVIEIFDMLGRSVARLVDKEQNAGSYSVLWNAGDMSSGLYIVSLKTSDAHLNRSIQLVK